MPFCISRRSVWVGFERSAARASGSKAVINFTRFRRRPPKAVGVPVVKYQNMRRVPGRTLAQAAHAGKLLIGEAQSSPMVSPRATRTNPLIAEVTGRRRPR